MQAAAHIMHTSPLQLKIKCQNSWRKNSQVFLKFTRTKNSWAKTGWCSHKPNVPIRNILTKDERQGYQILDLKHKWIRSNWWKTVSDAIKLAKTEIYHLGEIRSNYLDVSDPKMPSKMDVAPWDKPWFKMVLDGIGLFLDGLRWLCDILVMLVTEVTSVRVQLSPLLSFMLEALINSGPSNVSNIWFLSPDNTVILVTVEPW